MSRYGIDYYGLSYYGADTLTTFDASPFTARALTYGQIELDWVSPSGAWAKLRVVRNSYGFPTSPFDGTTILSVFRESDPTTFIDTSGLSEGAFYYYTVFVYETTQYSWVRAADAIGLSVRRHNNGPKMFEYLPEVYKLEKVYTVDTSINNQALASFLNIFGFQLDYIQTLVDLLIERYNVQKVGGTLVPSLLRQFGITYEPELGLQQSRILIRDAIQLYKEKGSSQGLREFVKAYSGYAVPAIAAVPNPTIDGVVVGHNLMLDYNDSSFEESVGHWSSVSNASLSRLAVKPITRVSLTSNVATLTIGAHNYKVGNQVYIQNMTVPLFSFPSTAKEITAVTATTISFALTAANLAERDASGIVVPFPEPREETTASIFYPNKQMGILSVTNSSASAGTVVLACGHDAPITKGIPVNAGSQYTFSVYTTADSSTRTITPGISWYNRFGVLLSTSTGTATANTVVEWATRLTASATAPTGAYYAVPQISIASVAGSASNEHHYFDCAQFEQAASATSFDEARQLHITPRATRINELLNPHFASPFTPWSITGGTATVDTTTPEPGVDLYTIINKALTSNVATLTTATTHVLEVGQSVVVENVGAPFDGTYAVTAVTPNTFSYAKTDTNVPSASATGDAYKAGNALRVTASAATVEVSSTTTSADLMPIHYPSTAYTFSVYAMTDVSAENVTLEIKWYDSSKVLISTETSSAKAITDSWTRVDLTDIAPLTAAYASVKVVWTVATGTILQLDSALFENSPFVLEYFDGSGGPGYDNDFLWEGGVIAGSRSHFYKNRLTIQLRIVEELKNFLSLGTTVAVYLAQPKT